jgi:hypothetical protein
MLDEAPLSTPDISAKPNKKKGISYRQVFKFEIKNEKLIPREYLEPNLSAIRKVVNATKGKANIPGIKITKEKQVIARGI